METKKTKEEIRDALIKVSWRTYKGEGIKVCYPNEVLFELFGEDVMKELWIKEDLESLEKEIRSGK